MRIDLAFLYAGLLAGSAFGFGAGVALVSVHVAGQLIGVAP